MNKPKTTTGQLRSRRTLSKYTLIELMVVLSIIAVLFALLVPALSLIKEEIGRNQCVNNQRNLLVSSNTWTTDNKNWVTPGTWQSKLYYGSYGFNAYVDRCPGAPEPVGLAPNYPSAPDYDSTKPIVPGFEASTVTHDNYGQNTNFTEAIPFLGAGKKNWGGIGNPWFENHGKFKVHQSNEPSELIYYIDSSTFYGGLWMEVPFTYSLYSSEQHDEGAVASFLDGTARFMTHDEIQLEPQFNSSEIIDNGVRKGCGGHHFKIW